MKRDKDFQLFIEGRGAENKNVIGAGKEKTVLRTPEIKRKTITQNYANMDDQRKVK
jgi:hypothetical protein